MCRFELNQGNVANLIFLRFHHLQENGNTIQYLLVARGKFVEVFIRTHPRAAPPDDYLRNKYYQQIVTVTRWLTLLFVGQKKGVDQFTNVISLYLRTDAQSETCSIFIMKLMRFDSSSFKVCNFVLTRSIYFLREAYY